MLAFFMRRSRLRYQIRREIGSIRPAEHQVMLLVHGAAQAAALAHLGLLELQGAYCCLPNAETA